MDRFRDFLTDWLARTGWSASRLARESGVRQNVISRWTSQTPTRPSPENLKKIAPVVGVSYEDLLRMCGYLPDGEADAAAEGDELERWLLMRTEEFHQAVRGIPRAFWPTVLDASIEVARQMQGQPEPPVTPEGEPGVTAPQAVVIVVPQRPHPRLRLGYFRSQKLLAAA